MTDHPNGGRLSQSSNTLGLHIFDVKRTKPTQSLLVGRATCSAAQIWSCMGDLTGWCPFRRRCDGRRTRGSTRRRRPAAQPASTRQPPRHRARGPAAGLATRATAASVITAALAAHPSRRLYLSGLASLQVLCRTRRSRTAPAASSNRPHCPYTTNAYRHKGLDCVDHILRRQQAYLIGWESTHLQLDMMRAGWLYRCCVSLPRPPHRRHPPTNVLNHNPISRAMSTRLGGRRGLPVALRREPRAGRLYPSASALLRRRRAGAPYAPRLGLQGFLAMLRCQRTVLSLNLGAKLRGR